MVFTRKDRGFSLMLVNTGGYLTSQRFSFLNPRYHRSRRCDPINQRVACFFWGFFFGFRLFAEPRKEPWIVWVIYGDDFSYPDIYGDDFINHERRIPPLNNQADSMESKGARVFFVRLPAGNSMNSPEIGCSKPSWMVVLTHLKNISQ